MTLLGASGLVGGHVARALADDPSVARLALPVRRLPAAGGGTPAGPGVRWLLVDFERLEGHREALSCDQLLVCLGTTRRDAGSAAAFRRVDHDYVVSASRLAVEEGALDLQVLSAAGADASSRLLYSRVKGEMEDAVSRLPFRSVTVLRPSLLLGSDAVPDRRRPSAPSPAASSRPSFGGSWHASDPSRPRSWHGRWRASRPLPAPGCGSWSRRRSRRSARPEASPQPRGWKRRCTSRRYSRSTWV